MSEDQEDTTSEKKDPYDRCLGTVKEAIAEIQAAHGRDKGAAETGRIEENAVTKVVEQVAQELTDGMDSPAGAFAGMIAEECDYYNKTDIKQKIKDKTAELKHADKTTLDEFILGNLVEVTVVNTTDHLQGAEYSWDFGDFKVETKSGKDGRGHFEFTQFRDLIHESGGVNVAPPNKNRSSGEDWRDFIIDMIDKRGNKQYTRGKRTRAYEKLSNKVRQRTGYGTAESALDHTGVWILRKDKDLPDWWASFSDRSLSDDRDLPADLVEEIRIHESVIEPIINEIEITRMALYHELKARDLVPPGTGGASMTVWVNGSNERFWALTPDLGTPSLYIPDPNAGKEADRNILFDEEPDEEPDQPTDQTHSESERNTGGFDSVGDVV